jgi:hypothetical protein
MKNESPHQQAESHVRDGASGLSLDALARRELLIGSAAFGAAILTVQKRAARGTGNWLSASGSVALAQPHQKLPLAQRVCPRAFIPSNVSNAERLPGFGLANEQRRLHFATGHAEWLVRHEQMPASGREQQFAMFPESRRWKIEGIGVGQVSGL